MKKQSIFLIFIAFFSCLLFNGITSSLAGSGPKIRPKTYCQICPRDSRGRIKRSASERMKFLKSKGLSRTPPGYQVDHVIPLSKGDADKAWNMQLVPKDSPKEKDELK